MIDDDKLMPLSSIGHVSTTNMSLSNVYYIPGLTLSLAYVSQLCYSGYSVTFSFTSYYVPDPHSRRLIEKGYRHKDFIFWMS